MGSVAFEAGVWFECGVGVPSESVVLDAREGDDQIEGELTPQSVDRRPVFNSAYGKGAGSRGCLRRYGDTSPRDHASPTFLASMAVRGSRSRRAELAACASRIGGL
jgi:hypothetical protein